MEVYHLPEFLNGGKEGEVYIHHYRSAHEYLKNKIALNKNLICILLSGTKEVLGPRQTIRIDSTEIMMVSAGNVLMWESIAENHKLESLLIFFSNEMLKETCARHSLNFSGNNAKTEAVLSMKKDDYIRAYETSLKALVTQGIALMQQIKVEELLVYLALINPSEKFQAFLQNVLGALPGNKLQDVVNANVDKGLTIDELAFLCNMSASTFKRQFEKAFKCSPKKYFTMHRMEKARMMLMREIRPSEIYLDLSYQNLSSFSTEFKKYFGVSPKVFQRKELSR
jgi:AraC-like DNA-binding protein